MCNKPGIYGFRDEYDFLSNFYRTPVFYEGILYPSSENAYQASKTDDVAVRMEFTKYTSGNAKRLGKLITITDHFKRNKIEIMFLINFDKFHRSTDIKTKLLATGNLYLEETNQWKDTFWGVYNEKGDNNLGKILMKIRECLRLNENNQGFVI